MSKVGAILNREFRMYWMSPIAYIVLTVFLVVLNWMFFVGFFIQGDANLGGLFGILPVIFLFVMPALTMRHWAEEKKSGTVELLMTKPVSEWEVVLGKFLATACLLLILLALTLPLTLTVAAVSQSGLDVGVTIASYAGAFFLGLAYLAIGSWVSSLTENQIIAFILGVVLIFILLIISQVTTLFSTSFALFLEYLGLSKHYSSIARGVIDSRDLIYYVSVIFFFLYLTVRSVESRKWS